MSTNPYEPPKDEPNITSCSQDDVRPGRFSVLGNGFLVGIALSIVVAISIGFEFEQSIFVAFGPILGTMCGMRGTMLVGWFGVLLAMAHPLKSSRAAGFVTLIGLLLHFLSGFWGIASIF